MHYETNACSYLTEFADDELISDEFKEVKHIFLKVVDVFRIIIIGIITYNDLRIWMIFFKYTVLVTPPMG